MKLADEEYQKNMTLNERLRLDNWMSERELVEILIYQHIFLRHLEVRVVKDSMKCLEKDLRDLRTILARPSIASIQELVDRGEFINLGQKLMYRKKAELEAPKAESQVEPAAAAPKVVMGKDHIYLRCRPKIIIYQIDSKIFRLRSYERSQNSSISSRSCDKIK